MLGMASRQMTRRRVLAGSLKSGAGIALAGLVGTAFDPITAAGQATGGTLRMGTHVDPVNIDPHHYKAGGIDIVVISLVTNGLLGTDRAGKVVPRLATSWDWVDKTTVRFHLRQGVTFHDGTPWNAQVAQANVDRMIKATELQGIFGQVAGAEAVDAATILVHTKAPYAPIIRNLASPGGGMLSLKAIREHDEEMARHPVGAGPFTVQEWIPRQRLVLRRNPQYWGTAPKLSGVIFRPLPEESTRLMSFQTSELDAIQDPVPSTVQALAKDPRYQVIRVEQTRNFWLGFKMQDPVVGKNLKLRQAIAHAIDRTALVRFVAEGLVAEARSFFPPAVVAVQPAAFPYDVSAAKRLLAEAGFPNGIRLLLRSPAGRYLKDQEIAQAIQSQLQVVGIQTDLKILEWGAYLQDILKPEGQQMYIEGWGFNTGDPDYGRGILASTGPFNSFSLKNPQVDMLFDRGAATSDEAQRRQIYTELDRLVVRDQAILVPIYFQVGFYAATRKVHDLYPTPLELLDLSSTWVES